MNIEEFARSIGVSPTTVSHAFSGRGNLSAATRERVLIKARELGYVPNTNARRLAKGKSSLVTLTWLTSNIGDHSFVMELIYSLIAPFRDRDYDLVLDIVADSPRQRRSMIERAKSQAEDVLLLYDGGWLPKEFLREIALPSHPVINLGMETLPAIPNTMSVKWNSDRSIGELVDILKGVGHSEFGLICQYDYDKGTRDMIQVVKSRVDVPDNRILYVGEQSEGGFEAFKGLMALPNPPTAVLARTDILAIGAMKAAHEMGMDVPGDISLSGQDDLPITQALHPTLTTVRMDLPDIARTVAETAFTLMKEPDIEPRTILCENSLLIRESTGPAKR